jgi:hypothetical protein
LWGFPRFPLGRSRGSRAFVRRDAIRPVVTSLARALRCTVTDRLPSCGKPYSDGADRSPSGTLKAVRAAMPMPPSSVAHRPSRLELLAADAVWNVRGLQLLYGAPAEDALRSKYG